MYIHGNITMKVCLFSELSLFIVILLCYYESVPFSELNLFTVILLSIFILTLL